MTKGKNSISNWEESHFGGFRKILSDYPEVKAPFGIDVEMPKDGDLPFYSREKLADIFQLKIKEHDLIDSFLAHAKTVKREPFWGGKKKTYLEVDHGDLDSTLDLVITLDEELANLFTHYKSLLSRSTFLYRIEDEEKKKEEMDGDGDMDGDKDEENSKEKEKDAKESEVKNSRDEKERCKRVASSMIKEIILRRKAVEMNAASVTGKLKRSTKFRMMKKGSTSCKYSASEITMSEQLLSLLDISFDPHSDRIDNLRTGKISTDKLASVPAGNFHIYHKIEENQTTKPFSVCILADESGSMGGLTSSGKGKYQNSMMKILYRTFSQILHPSKIFIYGHSDYHDRGNYSYPEIRVYNDAYNHIFEEVIEEQGGNRWGENYDGPVIECVYEKVRSVTSDNIIFISMSDGLPSGKDYGGEPAVKDMKRIIEKCKRDGFVTIGIGMLHHGVKDIYNYHTIIYNMNDMVRQTSHLINTVVKSEFQ